jgi:hypothetical protein
LIEGVKGCTVSKYNKGICTLIVSRVLFIFLSCLIGSTASAQEIEWEIAGNRFPAFATLEIPRENFSSGYWGQEKT